MSEQDQKSEQQESELGPEELEKVNGGAGCARVSKVDAFAIKQKVTESPIEADDLGSK